MMPVLDGLATLEQIRATPRIKSIPVALLTAKAQHDDRLQFAHLDVVGLIVKPFDPMTLVDQVMATFGWE